VIYPEPVGLVELDVGPVDYTEYLKEPQNEDNDDHPIQDGFYGSRHGDETIDGPKSDTGNDQYENDVNKWHIVSSVACFLRPSAMMKQ
jgi:hypothetical protein